MIPRRFVAFSIAGLAGAVAMTGLVPVPHLTGIAQALLDPKPQVEKPRMPVFAAAEEDARPAAGRTQDGITLARGATYVVLAFPAADVACSHGICTGLVIRTYRPVHPPNLNRHGRESMIEGFAGYPPS
jgi:uncharacterized protein YijF (DUF1287 family)